MSALSHSGGFFEKCLWYALILILLDHPLPRRGRETERKGERPETDIYEQIHETGPWKLTLMILPLNS